jgi:hypothetical protein
MFFAPSIMGGPDLLQLATRPQKIDVPAQSGSNLLVVGTARIDSPEPKALPTYRYQPALNSKLPKRPT